MSTLTGKDLNLVKPALTDDHKVTIGTDLPANFQKIDNEFTAHLADKASQEKLGHIKIGAGGSIDANGVYVPTGFKIGSFTRNMETASGTQVITGVGFTPRAVIFLAANYSSTHQMAIGIDTLSAVGTLLDYRNEVSVDGQFATSNNFSIYISIGTSIAYQGKISSLDSDGFTLSWTKSGAATGNVTILYLAIR